eukprot:2577091-Rhodomonas_salina.1
MEVDADVAQLFRPEPERHEHVDGARVDRKVDRDSLGGHVLADDGVRFEEELDEGCRVDGVSGLVDDGQARHARAGLVVECHALEKAERLRD